MSLCLATHHFIRRCGLPQAQKHLEEALELRTIDHIARDVFHSSTLNLTPDTVHWILRNGDWVATISINPPEAKVQRLALWSLITQMKVWEIELPPQSIQYEMCALSSTGMVMISPYQDTDQSYLLIKNATLTGTLPHFHWGSLQLEGDRVLSTWSLTGTIAPYFGEWNRAGKLISHSSLDHHPDRPSRSYTHNDVYWVRLSNSINAKLPPLIEVFNRRWKSLNKYELSTSKDKYTFSSICIVKDRLFYAKKPLRLVEKLHPQFPGIGIFDLVNGIVIKEIVIEDINATLFNLTANADYVAWSEKTVTHQKIQYYHLGFHQTISTGTELPPNAEAKLQLSGSLLTIIYAESHPIKCWHREVHNMEECQKVQEVRYQRTPESICSFDRGNLLLTDTGLGTKQCTSNPSSAKAPMEQTLLDYTNKPIYIL